MWVGHCDQKLGIQTYSDESAYCSHGTSSAKTREINQVDPHIAIDNTVKISFAS